MAHPMRLPALAMLALVAVGAGVQLGLGAVAEMDGAQQGTVEARPFASLSPYRSFGGSQPQLSEQPEEMHAREIGVGDLGGCYGCPPPVYYRGESDDDYASARLPAYEEPVPEAESLPLPVADTALPPAVDEMERYARYPVEAADSGTAVVDRW